MGNRNSARDYRRQEQYQRLAEIDAHRLKLSGSSVEFIAGRAATTPHFVRRWLKDVNAPAVPAPRTSTDDATPQSLCNNYPV
jgi:hypothetical protein